MFLYLLNLSTNLLYLRSMFFRESIYSHDISNIKRGILNALTQSPPLNIKNIPSGLYGNLLSPLIYFMVLKGIQTNKAKTSM